jgi:uncharacterized protein (TIGR03067 family)
VKSAATLLCIMAMASTGLCAGPKAPAKKTGGLNGRWVLTSGVRFGEQFSDSDGKSINLTLSNGKFTDKIGEQIDEGTYKVDDSKTPKTLTFTGTSGPNKGKTMLAIYELEKGTLTICYDMSGKAFPEKFESKPGTPSFLATYEREKGNKRSGFRVRRRSDAD